eukprot:1995153-Rhodomonas_salina.1
MLSRQVDWHLTTEVHSQRSQRARSGLPARSCSSATLQLRGSARFGRDEVLGHVGEGLLERDVLDLEHLLGPAVVRGVASCALALGQLLSLSLSLSPSLSLSLSRVSKLLKLLRLLPRS